MSLTACNAAPALTAPELTSDSTPAPESPSTPPPAETHTPITTATATATETNTPVPTAETAAIALFDKYNVDPDTYTLTEVDGVIVGTDKETGTEIFRGGRFEIGYAVELAKKDCEPTNIEPDKYGFVQQKDYESSDIYISTIISGLNYPTNGGFFFVLIDREKQCWAVADRNNLLYKDETEEHIIPIIPLTNDELFTFAMRDK